MVLALVTLLATFLVAVLAAVALVAVVVVVLAVVESASTAVVVAAFLAPPDIASMLVLAVPLIFLYELGILMVGFVYEHKG